MEQVANEIIDLLGGTTAVAKLIESPISTVHSWRSNGIPSSRLAHLRLVAKVKGVALPGESPAAETRTHGADSAIDDELLVLPPLHGAADSADCGAGS